MADKQSDRPSFTSFWKRSKGKWKSKGSVSGDDYDSEKSHRRVDQDGDEELPEADGTAKQSNSSASPNDPYDADSQQNKNLTAKEKAQLRRTQVRRAQIQHRQRKANYVKQLELDVSELREMISLTEQDAANYRKENANMRLTLKGIGVRDTTSVSQWPLTNSVASQSDFGGSQLESFSNPRTHQAPTQSVASDAPEAMDTQKEIFAGIDVDDLVVTLGVHKTMGTPCFQIRSNSSGASVHSSASPEAFVDGAEPLTPQQEQIAINFILALEHICWNHFAVGDFHCHDTERQSDDERGHTLMASAYCMARAPESVYSDRKALVSRMRISPAPTLQWGASNITLQDLHGLAMSLNPGGEEVAPVQAWFELANRYPADMLFRGGVLETLLAEFKGVVKCVFYGAAMEREAFESILTRVLGPTNITISPVNNNTGGAAVH